MNLPNAPLPSTSEPDALALRLGYAGLIPFIGGTLFIWLLNGRIEAQAFGFVMDAMAAYGAVIISFLGGIHWGLAMRLHNGVPGVQALRHRALWTGIAWSLGAWVAVCMPAHAGLVVMGALLIGCYVNDRRLYDDLGAHGWLVLRFRLTVVASLSCFLAAAQL